MNKAELRQLSEILKAYSEGRTIQISFKGREEWYDYTINNDEIDTFRYDYRVKPESEFVPYFDGFNFLEAQKIHGPYLQISKDSPFRLPTTIYNDAIEFDRKGNGTIKFEDLVKTAIWQDGTPCGISVVK